MSRTKRPEIVTTPPLMVARECAAAARASNMENLRSKKIDAKCYAENLSADKRGCVRVVSAQAGRHR